MAKNYKIETNGRGFRIKYEDGTYHLNDKGTAPSIFGSKESAEHIAEFDPKKEYGGEWVECD